MNSLVYSVVALVLLVGCHQPDAAQSPDGPDAPEWVYLPLFEDLEGVCAAIGRARRAGPPGVHRPEYGGPPQCLTAPFEVAEPGEGGGVGIANSLYYRARSDDGGRVTGIVVGVDVYNRAAETETLAAFADSTLTLFDEMGLAVPADFGDALTRDEEAARASDYAGFNSDYGVVSVHYQSYAVGYGVSVQVMPAWYVAG